MAAGGLFSAFAICFAAATATLAASQTPQQPNTRHVASEDESHRATTVLWIALSWAQSDCLAVRFTMRHVCGRPQCYHTQLFYGWLVLERQYVIAGQRQCCASLDVARVTRPTLPIGRILAVDHRLGARAILTCVVRRALRMELRM